MHYQPRYLVLSTRDADKQNKQTLAAIVPMRDTWNPRISFEWSSSRGLKIGGGYQFRPSAITDLGGPGNLLDANTHVTGLSFQKDLGNVLFFDRLSLGAYAQVHWLETQNIRKSNAEYVGSPGYQFSGKALVFGASLTSLL